MMAPDEASRILHKLDEHGDQLTEIKVFVASIDVEFKAHREAEAYAAEIREATCPQVPTLSALQNDINAIAAVGRESTAAIGDHTGRITALEAWRDSETLGDAVTGAEKRIILAPLKWALHNGQSIMLAVTTALLIALTMARCS